jgi:hypothetical protein
MSTTETNDVPQIYHNKNKYKTEHGRDRAVAIATRYGLDGPDFEHR